ncbi:gliding motility protein [Dyadobacter sp. CY323]|nr:gliding motility protein [Dyadobacter sp. CY323]
MQTFLKKYPSLTKFYFADTSVDSSQLAAHLFNISQNPDFQTFRTQLDSLIGDRQTEIVAPLTDAFKRIKVHYPGFIIPKIQFIVTGFTGTDLYISDSLIVIGLDYFGGPKALYRPNVFDYQLRRYQKEYIVPSIIFFESNHFNRMNPGDQSLLSDMIGYGKGYEFVKQILPNVPDSLVVGYSEENLRRTYNSQQQIWSYFIASKLLYEKSDLKKRKFIEERPFTTEIGEKVPGAIARWLGWRITSKFMASNPDITLVQLMDIDNAGRILQDSGYKGEPDEDE